MSEYWCSAVRLLDQFTLPVRQLASEHYLMKTIIKMGYSDLTQLWAFCYSREDTYIRIIAAILDSASHLERLMQKIDPFLHLIIILFHLLVLEWLKTYFHFVGYVVKMTFKFWKKTLKYNTIQLRNIVIIYLLIECIKLKISINELVYNLRVFFKFCNVWI